MSSVPWWILSPSPFTFVFWFVCVFWGMNRLSKDYGKYRFFEVAQILGLVVLSFDAVWCVFQGLRFGFLHPEGVHQLVLCFVRDLVAFLFCFLFVGHYFNEDNVKVLKFDEKVLGLIIVELAFMVLWFGLSPDPSYTDWTYAFRYGYDASRVIASFFISHVLAKFIQGLIFISLWCKK